MNQVPETTNTPNQAPDTPMANNTPPTRDQQMKAPTTDTENVMEEWENEENTLSRFETRLESQEFATLLEKLGVKMPSTLQLAATKPDIAPIQPQDLPNNVPPMTQASESTGSGNPFSSPIATEHHQPKQAINLDTPHSFTHDYLALVAEDHTETWLTRIEFTIPKDEQIQAGIHKRLLSFIPTVIAKSKGNILAWHHESDLNPVRDLHTICNDELLPQHR